MSAYAGQTSGRFFIQKIAASALAAIKLGHRFMSHFLASPCGSRKVSKDISASHRNRSTGLDRYSARFSMPVAPGMSKRAFRDLCHLSGPYYAMFL